MKRLLPSCLFLALALAGMAVPAQNDSTPDAERARIASQRSQADKLLAAQESACYQKFGVNDCLKSARAQRREKLSDLRRQELTLNDAERKRRAGERVLSIDERNSAQRQEEAAAQRAESAARQREKKESVEQRAAERAQAQASAPVRTVRTPKERQPPNPDGHTAKAPRSHDTAKALRQAAEREQEAMERRERVARRLAESKRPEVKPLPVPP